MGRVKSIAEEYWIAYYLVYVVCVGFGIWKYQPLHEQGKDAVYLLAAIFSVAAGSALLVAILLEVTGRMVLLIPDAVRKLKEQGRQEGRKEERKRVNEALERLAARSKGGDSITLTPEDVKLLRGASDNNS